MSPPSHGQRWSVPSSYLERGSEEWLPKKKKKDSVLNTLSLGFPGGAVVKNPPANAGNTGSSPGPGRSHMPQSN